MVLMPRSKDEKLHPAATIDVDAAAHAFAQSLTGRGPHWDVVMVEKHSTMANAGSESIPYVIDHCIEIGLCSEEPESGSEEETAILNKWCELRAPTCKKIKEQIVIKDGHVLAFRIIDSNPEDIDRNLGIFWSHDLGNWDDPVTPWGKGRGQYPTLLIEARVPVEAIDWQVSCMAHMDWMVGDTESELRLRPGYPLKDVKFSYVSDGKPIAVPDRGFVS